VPNLDVKAERFLSLSKDELTLLVEFLEYQFLSYEKPELIELVRRLGRAYNELASEAGESAH